jgi:DNA-binding MarR family transcriptional regulator
MHAIFFGVKRVHIEVVRLTRWMISHSNLTPARFDLLRIVQLYEDGIAQGTIQWLLGVTAPVVSRMIKALHQLGFVDREVHPRDGRSRWIRLTPRGLIALRVAASATLADFEAERTAARLVTGNKRLESESREETLDTIERAQPIVAHVDRVLVAMRIALVDRAPYRHPWQPMSEQPPPLASRTVGPEQLAQLAQLS